MNAKQIAHWTLIVVFVLGSRLAGAQPGGDFGGDFGGGMPPFAGDDFQQQRVVRPDNRKAAKRMTDEMQRSLILTDKQYKKVYKVNLIWLDECSSQSATEGECPVSMSEGPVDDGERYGNRPEGPGDTSESGQRPAVREMSVEEVAARNAKLRKILTADQYDRWQKSEVSLRNPARGKQPDDLCRER